MSDILDNQSPTLNGLKDHEVFRVEYQNDFTEIPESVLDNPDIKAISIEDCPIGELPDRLYEMSQLVFLMIWEGAIVDISHKIGQLANLVELHLSGPNLWNVPSEAFELVNLEYLSVSGSLKSETPDKIDWIPHTLGKLTKLRALHLEHHGTAELPSELCQLTQLEQLDMTGNNLQAFPEGFEKLENLDTLWAGDNNFTVFPENIPRSGKLRSLWLNKNPITHIYQQDMDYWNAQNQVDLFLDQQLDHLTVITDPKDDPRLAGQASNSNKALL